MVNNTQDLNFYESTWMLATIKGRDMAIKASDYPSNT